MLGWEERGVALSFAQSCEPHLEWRVNSGILPWGAYSIRVWQRISGLAEALLLPRGWAPVQCGVSMGSSTAVAWPGESIAHLSHERLGISSQLLHFAFLSYFSAFHHPVPFPYISFTDLAFHFSYLSVLFALGACSFHLFLLCCFIPDCLSLSFSLYSAPTFCLVWA